MKNAASILIVLVIILASITFYFVAIAPPGQSRDPEPTPVINDQNKEPSKEPTLFITPKITMQIKSPEFDHNETMPSKYTCEGENVSPPLTFSEVPENTETLALIVDDPDAPDPEAPKMTWVHWVVFNIDPETTEVVENSIPKGGIQGTNNFDKLNYGGPCPPIGEHRYFFKLYALDTKLDLDTSATKDDLVEAMDGHVLDEAELIGLYEKQIN